MTLRVSTGYKALILGPTAFEDIFRKCTIRVFEGPQPASADDAETGDFLGQYTMGGLPFRSGFDENGLDIIRSGAFIGKRTEDPWALYAERTGTPGWFRIVGNAEDEGDASFALPRIDGSIGLSGSGAEMQLVSISFVANNTYPLDYFFYTIPPVVGL